MGTVLMAGAGKKWALGCAVGCGTLMLLGVIVITAGVFQARRIVRDFEAVDERMDALAARHGRIADFHPDADGTIRPERVEAFLAARQAMAPTRESMDRSLGLLAQGERGDFRANPLVVLRMIRAGAGLIPGIAEFYDARGEALLESGMGLGEYLYLYAVVYYSWLGKSPADGPPFVLVGDDHDHRDEPRTEQEVRRRRLDATLEDLNRKLLPMLRHQLAALGSMDDAWRERLAAEISAMQADRKRLPWQDGLPERIERSLEPYRSGLEQSYSELSNALEVGLRGSR